MNAPLRHPTREAGRAPATNYPEIPDSSISRDWHAVLRPFMGRWEPIVVSGKPLMFLTPGLARAAASGHPGGSDLYMGRSPVAPTLEAIRAAANPPRETCPAVSFDVTAMDGGHDQKSAFRAWRQA